jgi:hypothetical protein
VAPRRRRPPPAAETGAVLLQPTSDVVGELDRVVRRTTNELAWVEDERGFLVHLTEPGQFRLLNRGDDGRLLVVAEHPE